MIGYTQMSISQQAIELLQILGIKQFIELKPRLNAGQDMDNFD